MSETPINDNEVTQPEENAEPLDSPITPVEPVPAADENLPAATSDDPDDPLYRLRQSLMDEEAKTDETAKPAGFFQRVAGGLKGKRSQPAEKPEEPPTPAPRFGVHTALVPVFPPPVNKSTAPVEPENEEIQDEFLEKRLGTGPLSQEWRRPAASEASQAEESPADAFDNEAREYLSGARAASERIQSPFSTNISHMSPINWEDEDQSVPPGESRFSAAIHSPSSEPAEPVESTYPYLMEEKKTITAGAEKKTQPAPFIAYQPSGSFAQRLQSIPPLERVLLAILGLAVIGVIVMLAVFYTQSRTPAAVTEPIKTVAPTATASGVPIPVNLRLTGGWNFPLQRSTMVRGKWVPAGSEWLEGTEIRRVVGIPWNKQTEAVLQSMATNDRIELVMNNGDILTYKVASVGQVPARDTSILYDTKPSLVIVLINPDDENRWVVIAYP